MSHFRNTSNFILNFRENYTSSPFFEKTQVRLGWSNRYKFYSAAYAFLEYYGEPKTFF